MKSKKDWSGYDFELYQPKDINEAVDMLRWRANEKGNVTYADGKGTRCAMVVSLHIIRAIVGGTDEEWEGTICHSSYADTRRAQRECVKLDPETGAPRDKADWEVVDNDEDKVVLTGTQDECVAWAVRHNQKVAASGGDPCFVAREVTS